MQNFLKFIDKAKTQYHATCELAKILKENGYTCINEEDDYNLKSNSKYYVVRNNSSILAFKTPNDINNTTLKIVASHTDSPTLKVKPNNMLTLSNYSSLNVEVYGGPIYSSFFDRPLSLAGRVFVNTDDGIEEHLFDIDRDLLVIPNECIHFNREVNSGKNYNPQIDLIPLLGKKDSKLDTIIAKELNVKEEDILSYDLQVYNRFRGTIIGANNEYFMAPQIDNLESAYATLQGFLKSSDEDSFNVWVSFDNEEVGSSTKQGAHSDFLSTNLKRAFTSLNAKEGSYYKAIASGMLVSCDNAHAVHPNDIGKTDSLNKVFMNEGIVIKHNANQAYTTDGLSSAIIKKIFKESNIKYQDFTNRSDVRGGSTLGALSLQNVSIKSVDIGLAQLAMHSACETAGTKDLDTLVSGMKAFYDYNISNVIKGKY